MAPVSVLPAKRPTLEQPATVAAATQTTPRPRSSDPTRAFAASSAFATPSALDLLFDASGFTAEVAQIIELGPADIATSFHLDFRDGGAMGLEHALHALAMRNLSDRKRRVEPPVPLRDHDAFIGLESLAIAFRHAHLHDHGVPGCKVGDVLLELLLFDLVDNLGHNTSSAILIRWPLREITLFYAI